MDNYQEIVNILSNHNSQGLKFPVIHYTYIVSDRMTCDRSLKL